MYCLTSFGNDLDTLELYDIDKDVFCKLPSLNFLYDNNDICGRCEVLGRDDYVYHVVDKSLIYLIDRGKYMKAVLAGIMPSLTKDELLEDPMEVYNYNPILCYLDTYCESSYNKVEVKNIKLLSLDSNYMCKQLNLNCNYICILDYDYDMIMMKKCNFNLSEDEDSVETFTVKSLILYNGSWKLAIKLYDDEVVLVDVFTFEISEKVKLKDFLKDIDFEHFFDKGRF